MTQKSVLLETKLLVLICMIDIAITSWLYLASGANPMVERNPLMRYFMVKGGLMAFYLAKMAFTLPAVATAEWYRSRNPLFIVRTLRFAILAYLVVFIGGIGLSFIGTA